MSDKGIYNDPVRYTQRRMKEISSNEAISFTDKEIVRILGNHVINMHRYI